MAAGDYLRRWVLEALEHLGGRGTIVEVCRQIWHSHETDLRALGDPFYTWQYDVRWAAFTLRDSGETKITKQGTHSVWELTGRSPRRSRD